MAEMKKRKENSAAVGDHDGNVLVMGGDPGRSGIWRLADHDENVLIMVAKGLTLIIMKALIYAHSELIII